MARTLRSVATGTALLGVLPLRLAGLVAGRWLADLHAGGARNAASALDAFRDEAVAGERLVSVLAAARA